MLEVITFTGADDATDPSELIRFSKEFPFVEWGILVGSRDQVPRMPSRHWIETFLNERAKATHRVRISLHVCGRPLREIAEGHSSLFERYGDLSDFERVQLNWHGDRQGDIGARIATAFLGMKWIGESVWMPELIFQGDETNAGAGLHCAAQAAGYQVSMLFDTSHGAGEVPGCWPIGHRSIKCGWAGGLGPDNIEHEHDRIRGSWCSYEGARLPYWLDMESKVRREPLFDLGKCIEVAELMKSKIGK